MANPATRGAGALVAILHGSSWRTVGRDLRRRGWPGAPREGTVSCGRRFPWSKKMVPKPIPGGFSNDFWYVHPELWGKRFPILTSILFKWVGSTTNQKTHGNMLLGRWCFWRLLSHGFPIEKVTLILLFVCFLVKMMCQKWMNRPILLCVLWCSSWCEHPMMFLGSKNNLNNKLARWWVHFFIIFTPIWGKIPILINIFSRRLKPPTSWGGGFNPFEGISCTNH